ncbi:hypothetical protein AVEN_67569-1 [Araneus ventricosus]|uniref:Uncharacterized protein n=1 Tax=Araneus ventricosus TaxID=182803 RepID=A0A4Y2TYL8_ARAVE|nr:hypothetical protein AVEN_67569-1 [Araneus ventricosus]
MSLNRRKQYQQLTQSEHGHVIGLREGGFFFFMILQKDLEGLYPLCLTAGSSGHWEGFVSRRPGSGRTRASTEREDRHTCLMAVIVLHLQQKLKLLLALE